MCEESLRAAARCELARELMEKSDALARGTIAVERVWCRAGKERCEQVVNAFAI